MVAKNRGHFAPGTIRALRERVNGICSNPDCRNVTLGPHETNNDKPIIVGEAAHICAAMPGAARYDPSMTEEQRHSIDNGIWLCEICAKLIDRDEIRYPVTLLQAWKKKSEDTAAFQLGKPIVGHNEVLTGLALIASYGSSDYGGALTHYIRAYEQKLEARDPRWNVRVNYVDGMRQIKLEPAPGMPPVQLTVSMSDPDANKTMEDISLFGGEAEFSGLSLRVTGSPLLSIDGKKDVGAKFAIIGHSEDLKCRFNVLDKHGKTSLFYIDAVGKLYSGTAGVKMAITALDGLFSMSWNFDLRNKNKFYKTKLSSINFSLEKWEGQSVNSLGGFDKLFRFCKIYEKESPIKVDMETDSIGKASFNAKITINNNKELLLYLRYTEIARTISQYLNYDIFFSQQATFSGNEYNKLELIYKIIKNGYKIKTYKKGKPIAHGKINITGETAKELMELLDNEKTTSFTIEDEKTDNIKLFGAEIELPILRRTFNNTIIKTPGNLGALVSGTNITVEFWPSKNFSHEVEYVDKRRKLT